MKKLRPLARLRRQICSFRLVFQRAPSDPQQIQRFHNNRVMRVSHGVAAENRLARAKLCAD
jgi:hypothetical protein